MKILIIEDDLALANVLSRRLSRYGHQCQHADNGSSGLNQCRNSPPDVILLDMKLKDDNGLKYITLLRNIVSNARIILMTGYASIATAVDAIKLGADEYLAKPIDSQTLLAAIEGSTVNNEQSLDTKPLSSEQVEWEHINQVLKFNDGNVSATARQLSMHRRTLQRKLQKRALFNTHKE